MSIQDLRDMQTLANEFRTRRDFSYEFNVPYSTLNDRVRRGEVTLHFIDNKVQVNVEEALKACAPKRQKKLSRYDLFA
jgi:predicted kinase